MGVNMLQALECINHCISNGDENHKKNMDFDAIIESKGEI
jgi:hypothetical protein